VLLDQRPGNRNQVLAVAEALGWPFATKEIGYGPLARLPNWLLGRSLLGLTPAARASLVPPWPALVITAGRRSLSVARWLKRRQPAAFLVQLMWPGSARGLDLIAVPAHDGVADRPHLIHTAGVPHRITAARLAEAAAALAPRLADLPRPWIACLVGGSNLRVRFTRADATALGRQASALARECAGSLLIITSRRTDARCIPALMAALDGPGLVHRWTPQSLEQSRDEGSGEGPDGSSEKHAGTADNPYLGLLGAADAIIVTADSASMCMEACATGKPVFLFRPAAGVSRRLARLHAALQDQGRLCPLGSAWPERRPPPPNPADAVADAIRARLARGTDQRSRGAGGSAGAPDILNLRDQA
jgi:uncharacterized protein